MILSDNILPSLVVLVLLILIVDSCSLYNALNMYLNKKYIFIEGREPILLFIFLFFDPGFVSGSLTLY
jgi:hypothetical protein